MTPSIQYTGDAETVIYSRFRDDRETLRFDGDATIDVDADIAADAVARYPDVVYDPPQCGALTGDETPCERPVETVGATCHQHDDEPDETTDDRPYIQRARDAEANDA